MEAGICRSPLGVEMMPDFVPESSSLPDLALGEFKVGIALDRKLVWIQGCRGSLKGTRKAQVIGLISITLWSVVYGALGRNHEWCVHCTEYIR